MCSALWLEDLRTVHQGPEPEPEIGPLGESRAAPQLLACLHFLFKRRTCRSLRRTGSVVFCELAEEAPPFPLLPWQQAFR